MHLNRNNQSDKPKIHLHRLDSLCLQMPEPADAGVDADVDVDADAAAVDDAVHHILKSWGGCRLQRNWILDGWGSNPAMTLLHLSSTAQSSTPCLSSCSMHLKHSGRAVSHRR